MLPPKRPTTEKQREAARINGAKSRGPVTPEGKINSSHCGIAHSLLAKTVLLDGESKERFAALLASLCLELEPETDIEMSLVESLALARWRQRRLQAIEKVAVLAETLKHPDAQGPVEKTTEAHRALSNASNWLGRMNQTEIRYARQYSRTLKEYRDYRASRRRVA